MILAGTGHRPPKLGGYGTEAALRLRAFLRFHLEQLKPQCVIVGMALGFDQALGWACVEAGVPFTAAVPFRGYDALWHNQSRVEFDQLLRLAIGVHYVCRAPYAPWKLQKRNEWMCTQLKHKEDRLLALWDGSKEGGTYNCIKYAESKGIKHINLWPKWLEWDSTPKPFVVY